MITIETIKQQLENIRYYYGRKETFEKAFNFLGKNSILQTVDTYNQAICHASPRLYEVYIAIYINCCTYELAAETLGFSVSHIYRVNREIIDFFYNEFNKEAA